MPVSPSCGSSDLCEQRPAGPEGLQALDIKTVQVNVGLRCNQSCRHCHLNCSPERTETMDWPTMAHVLSAAETVSADLVDITGGAPELNPNLARFIETLGRAGRAVQVRTNLTALLEPGLSGMIEFFREHGVRLVASMPCYLEENVTAQRGDRVYQMSIEAIRRLNAAGYGTPDGLQLNLVYNPGGPSLPPEQSALEGDYRRELSRHLGLSFTRLLVITNMPLGRFGEALRRQSRYEAYMDLLRQSFNPATVEGLMCRHQVSVGWDGTLYDCDFNLALGWPVNHGVPNHIQCFDPATLRHRRIITGPHCLGCTAGHGSSCGGTLA